VRIQARLERRYLAWIITVLMILIAIVCVMVDLVYYGSVSWSLYVALSLALSWITVLFPLLAASMHPVMLVLLDACALLAFLYVLNESDPSSDWYLRLAMPQVMLFGMLGLLNVFLWRSSFVHGWQKISVVVVSIGVAMMGLETLLDLFNDMAVTLDWSWFVIIPAFAVGLIFFILERKRLLKDAITKRLRI
jgi:hypothetical protein